MLQMRRIAPVDQYFAKSLLPLEGRHLVVYRPDNRSKSGCHLACVWIGLVGVHRVLANLVQRRWAFIHHIERFALLLNGVLCRHTLVVLDKPSTNVLRVPENLVANCLVTISRQQSVRQQGQTNSHALIVSKLWIVHVFGQKRSRTFEIVQIAFWRIVYLGAVDVTPKLVDKRSTVELCATCVIVPPPRMVVEMFGLFAFKLV